MVPWTIEPATVDPRANKIEPKAKKAHLPSDRVHVAVSSLANSNLSRTKLRPTTMLDKVASHLAWSLAIFAISVHVDLASPNGVFVPLESGCFVCSTDAEASRT